MKDADKVYDYIAEHTNQCGFMPETEDIAKHLGYTYASRRVQVDRILRWLDKNDYIDLGRAETRRSVVFKRPFAPVDK